MITRTIQAEASNKRAAVPLQKLIIGFFLFGLTVIFSLVSPSFFNSQNLLNIVRQVSYVIIAGSGITLLMIAGYLDLSVGSAAALSGVAMALLAKAGVSMPIAILFAVILGIAMGLVNGLLTASFGIPPFIATLGTMMIFRGTALIIADGKTVRDNLPQSFGFLGRGEFLGLPFPFWFMFLAVALMLILQKRSLLGKYSIAMGGNRLAAELSGINVRRMVFLLYTIVGALVGFTGAIQASRLGVGEPNIGVGFEFDVIVAVILGGTTLTGGEGSVIGMVIGALIVGVISNGLDLLGVMTFYQSIIKGVILVVAVLLDQSLRKREA
jgi:ribose/xylose/arabinose/galactoside ABC-type transport system permease subunit